MRTNLYYIPASDEGVPFLGHRRFYSLGNNSALENVYRVNVGRNQISPGDDTGMFRSWSNDEDYLTIAKPSELPVNTSANLTFSDITSFSLQGRLM